MVLFDICCIFAPKILNNDEKILDCFNGRNGCMGWL